jgi:SAM-dependent methyltransferase
MGKVKQYQIISKFYSHLMDDVDYDSWAEYIRELFDEYECENEKVLEVASGTCTLASSLKQYDLQTIATDNSLPMLQAAENSIDDKLCCDMRRIPFKRKFDFIFSAFDSVNYLLTENDLSLMFESVSEVLTEDGIFTFDVSLEQNSLNNLEHLNRKGKAGNFEFTQKSYYDKVNKIHINEFEITTGSETFTEIHKQRIYNFFDYFDLIDNSPLYAADCFEAFTFDDAKPDSDRVQFILKRRN